MRKTGFRLRDRGGFTLVELLAACVVLILLGLILSAGLSAAAKSYHDVTAESEAQLLLSTLADAVMDDLRFARDLELNGNALVSYTSDSYGPGAKLTVADNGQLTAGVAGEYAVLPPGAYRREKYRVAAESTRADGALAVEYDKGAGIFTLNLKIEEAAGRISAETVLAVRCLNPGNEKEGEAT